MESSNLISYEELSVGMSREREYTVSSTEYEGFLRLFGDASPLHIDSGYAEVCGFEGKLMHGAILNGFVSHFIGMVFPGGRSLELSVDIRFLQPVYLGDRLRLEGTVAQKLEIHQVVVLHLKFQNLTRGTAAATARVQAKMMAALP